MRFNERERIESSASVRFFSVSEEPQVIDDPSNVSQNIGGGNASETKIGGEAAKDLVNPKIRRRHSEGDIRREDGDEDEGGLTNSERGEKSPKPKRRGRPVGSRKTDSTGGNAGDPDLPTASQGSVQRKSGEVKFPCGVCSSGVRSSGILCGACHMWVHNGKTKRCATLSGLDENQPEAFRCLMCVENGRKIELHLRSETSTLSKNTGKDCESEESDKNKNSKNSKNGINRTKRVLTDPSPKKDNMGNPIASKKQRADIDHVQDYEDVFEKQIFKTCIDCKQNYEAFYDDPTMIKCWLCGLASHGCIYKLGQQIKRELELCMISRGHIWLCHECKNDASQLREQNENWRGETEPAKVDDEDEVEVIKDCTNHSEAEKGKLNKSEGTTNNNKLKTNQVVEDKDKSKEMDKGKEMDKSKEMDICNFEVMNISKESLASLERSQWVDDDMIKLSLALKQKEINKSTDKILFVSPAITQLIRASKDGKAIKETLKGLRITERDWVLFPVSNNNQVDMPGGGTHWSLLLYSRQKNVFYHHDPIFPINFMHATELINKISTADSSFSINRKNVETPQQKNGYDCGPYVMLFANKIVDNLSEGLDPNHLVVSEDEASVYRMKLKEKILREMKKVSAKPDIKRDDTKRHDICWRHINYMCWRGVDCRFKHPNLCESLVDGTPCGTGKELCNLYHPEICRNYLWYKVCKWGDRCKYRHIDNMKGHRRESDGPMFRRNYNINNEHINEYRHNGSHPNRHRGSQNSNYNDNKHLYNTYNKHLYNTHNSYRYNEDNHRNLHHPRGKYNRNTHFFGHQKNPTDWPTPMEAELLKTLRKFLQSGPNGWGPARG